MKTQGKKVGDETKQQPGTNWITKVQQLYSVIEFSDLGNSSTEHDENSTTDSEEGTFEDALEVDPEDEEWEWLKDLVEKEGKNAEKGVSEITVKANPILPISAESKKMEPSVEDSPSLKLKPLPDFLKYAFIGPDKKLPVIISSALTNEQEGKLLAVLENCKLALGWTIADIKGISPAICMHKILLKE